MSPLLPLAAALAALALWLSARLFRAGRARTAARAAYFDALKALADAEAVRVQPSGFPRMTLHRGGLSFDLQAVPDSLSFRKLPALWVMVSLPEPLPLDATLDLMARPSGQEPFSRFASLPRNLPTPQGLPTHLAVRTDRTGLAPPPALLAGQAALFDDPNVKELVLSPNGLRIVILAEEADRGRFLIFRDAEMGMTPLHPARIAPLLDRLRALREDVIAIAKAPA